MYTVHTYLLVELNLPLSETMCAYNQEQLVELNIALSLVNDQ